MGGAVLSLRLDVIWPGRAATGEMPWLWIPGIFANLRLMSCGWRLGVVSYMWKYILRWRFWSRRIWYSCP